MIRVNVKLALLVMCVAIVLVSLSLWTRCGESIQRSAQLKTDNDVAIDAANEVQGYEEIDCNINGEYSVGCRKEGGEVYVPFSFLRKYFEVYGKMVSYDGLQRFEWSHSYSKVYYPKGKYDPRGVFLYFENYNVEVRERVKCVSAVHGVPVSIQWQSEGYLYPIQIAQFGLSHYSKNLTEPEPRRRTIEDGDRTQAKWMVSDGSFVSRSFDQRSNSRVLKFDARAASITLKLDHVLDLILSADLRMDVNASIRVTLATRDRGEKFRLHYTCGAAMLEARGEHTTYGLAVGGWRRITRDLLVDVQKGLMAQGKKRKISRSKIKVLDITLDGVGALDNLTLSSSEHLSQFYDAAEWFVRSQDATTGGWPNDVTRHLTAAIADLQPGWYSAMGQGHALSVLARAYHHSGGDERYLKAALDGLKVFKVPSKLGGVRAVFMDKYPWYEEYPTDPPTFVLNGFIFALLGLYDLSVIAPSRAQQAAQLFDLGMESLKHLLLLYDTGSGSSYDLRHVSLGAPPNLARWDYHATHVNQLLLLATIDPDPLLSVTAERWIGYMAGKRANHN